MATVKLCIGSYSCPPRSRNKEFHRIPTQNSRSSCRASLETGFEIIAFLLKGGSPAGAHGHGFLSMATPLGALHSEMGGMHAGSSLEEHSFCNVCRSSSGSCGQIHAISGIPINRRVVTTLLLFTCWISADVAIAADEEVRRQLDLETYTDEKEGFTILRPTQWTKVEKAGATVLFEDPQAKGNNVGVIVNPVRISSLNEFGTMDVVADKLLQAEKRKPSTNGVQLIKVNQRQVHGGAPLYQLEYKLDSSRGVKRIVSAVTVASRKLYILNVAYADSSEKPLLPETALVLEEILSSFDVLD